MAWRTEKESNGDVAIVIDGFEMGIQPSPHKGIANIQNGNIATETGEVMASFGRIQQSQMGTSSTAGTLTPLDTSHLIAAIPSSVLTAGVWITTGTSTITGLSSTTDYYVKASNTGTGSISISLYYGASAISGFGLTGSCTFTLKRGMGQAVAAATEIYNTTGDPAYRYYVLDNQGLVWVYDSAQILGVQWFLPDASTTYFAGSTKPSGIAVLNGWLILFASNLIYAKATVNLGGSTSASTTWTILGNPVLMSQLNSTNPHFAFVGHQGSLYYTDGDYIGSLTPDIRVDPGGAATTNIQSFCSYSGNSNTGTITQVISGSIPSTGINIGGTGYFRIPAVFFTAQGGSLPSAITADTVYYIAYGLGSTQNFQVFAAATGGSAINVDSGSSGVQYFNTFYPIGSHAGPGGDATTCIYTPQRMLLPTFEIAQCMTELGNSIIIGCNSNVLYPWNQVDTSPSGLIFLPENKVQTLITVNQMVYVFAGYKGNVYITDGSVASLVIKVPDYCAGIAGTPASYIEPVFTWGGAMYLRGRVYFSVLDQTAAKAGNCGGVWSFIPTQNLYIGQDTGLALRLENQNSYGSYNGVATILIPSQTQNAISPQYWSAWYSSISAPSYGIDFTNTTPVGSTVIELDLVPVGTMLVKKTFKQVEYKLAAPLANGETITGDWRLSGTDSYTSLGTVNADTPNPLSGYFPATLEKMQWGQVRLTLNPLSNSFTSFIRLKEIRIR